MRKKERFVLGKRTFRSQKSKHFVLRIIPGIYKIFKEKELSTSQLAMTTSLMIYNRKHYRTQIKEYREHLKRKQYAWLYFWLYTPFPRLMRSILLPFVWLYNRWIQPRGANAFK